MDHRSGDDLLERVVGELRELPPIDEAQITRIVAAAQAAGRDGDERDEPGVLRLEPTGRRWTGSRGLPLAWAAALVLAAGVGGYLVGDRRGEPTVASALAPTPPARGVVAVAAAENAPRLTQFMIEAPRAERVALVGDFNGWDASMTPLVRDPSSGLWTATVALAPGRHTYAFMVDSTITLDPRAPESRDPDLGTRSSVVLVGGR
ncbi:MAG TPA: hypothetical protein VEA99_14955 [Gemmatimonadaceae bacterium]|nr:hypothetical protein [Gemmatimonadaceae bacterium]